MEEGVPQGRPQDRALKHRVGQNNEIRKHTLNCHPANPGLQVGVEEIEEHIRHPQGTKFAHHEILEHPVKGARDITQVHTKFVVGANVQNAIVHLKVDVLTSLAT